MSAPVEGNKVIIDESANVTYVGIACYGKEGQTGDSKGYLVPGDKAKNIWQIRKIETSNGIIEVSYPNGDKGNNYAWDDRAILNYK